MKMNEPAFEGAGQLRRRHSGKIGHSRRFLVLTALGLLALSETGCGRRGAPELPPDAVSVTQSEKEASMPSGTPTTNGSDFNPVQGNGSVTIGGTGRPAVGQAPDQPNQPTQTRARAKPVRPFLLDPML